jgi:arylsulfatase A-like enzyme
MRKFILSLLAGLLMLPACKQGEQTGNDSGKARRPNIVFILIDDLGWSDVGYNGSRFYDTPDIDKLAGQGMQFTQAYAACSVCSPTRASIITGKYPARLHLTDWLPGRKDYPFQKLKNPEINQHLPYDISTLPGILRENGYRTAIFGKWHMGEDSASAQRQGFELHLPRWNKGWPNGTYFSPYHMEGLEGGSQGEYLTDRLTDETLKYIDEHKNEPFFVYLAHFAVHDPIMGKPGLVNRYSEKLQSGGGTGQGNPFILEGNPDSSDPLSREDMDRLIVEEPYHGYDLLPQRTVKIKQQQDNTEFAAMVESVDQSVGRILGKIRELGLEENTIVVFFSDNGGMSAANYGNPTRKINESKLDEAFSTSNLPLRGGKGWFYEGGIREPLIIKWPDHVKAGSVCDVPVISVDFLPTLLDMAGIPFDPEKLLLDGKSMAPLLAGKEPKEDRPIFWHFPHYSNHGQQSPCGAIRYGNFKLIEYYENQTVQLFNLATDLSEQHNLSDSLPEKAEELREMLHQWKEDVDAQMMAPNQGFDPSVSWLDFAEGDKK